MAATVAMLAMLLGGGGVLTGGSDLLRPQSAAAYTVCKYTELVTADRNWCYSSVYASGTQWYVYVYRWDRNWAYYVEYDTYTWHYFYGSELVSSGSF